ncbi:cupin domain-containing protein [Flavihumibacter petaseus]|uniref:Cupin 2 conserved barrel domain-containing protein n=1 Tax=Flavihumibacter petaseus NBRC 106054 TaxID=1220578 RepID=A0A0E9MYY5_9BACT|nr:cupin domain-containing protein [Flavihumibacter petaseus]GAO42743.1 hypothetical protein FPE01S_01_17610 [Flavihumibacter petaseus NBRC 106054]
MTLQENYGTLSQTVNGLAAAGYTTDFNIREDCLVCQHTNTVLSPQEFNIDKVYRFEGASDPDDQAVVYAISSPKFGMKGVLVNGYGIFADEASSKLVDKLKTHTPARGSVPVTIDATPQRPEGKRIIDGPLVEINLPGLISEIKAESTWKESAHNAITVFKSSSMRIVLMGLHRKAELKPHQANGVISVQVLEGSIQFTTGDQAVIVKAGQLIALEENLTHSVVALEESFFLLTLALTVTT